MFEFVMGVLFLLFSATTSTESPTADTVTQTPAAGTVFKDCADCPEMVVIPAGSFVVGSPLTEAGGASDESPQHTVNIGTSFAAGRFEVTREQYAQFVAESGYAPAAPANCYYLADLPWVNDDPAKDWRNPGFVQGFDHPIVCISWDDATAYATWLSRKTARSYRLLTEAEWEYAARAGSNTARPWGDNPDDVCAHASISNRTFGRQLVITDSRMWGDSHQCNHGYAYTASVGRFPANKFGLHDMIGNALEWTADCLNWSYAEAPSDDSAWLTGLCARRVYRGGAWVNNPRFARSAGGYGAPAGDRVDILSFRLARTF